MVYDLSNLEAAATAHVLKKMLIGLLSHDTDKIPDRNASTRDAEDNCHWSLSFGVASFASSTQNLDKRKRLRTTSD
eukprot:3944402-Amphidinium_carterae.2